MTKTEYPANQFENSDAHQEFMALGATIVCIWDNGEVGDRQENIVQYADGGTCRDLLYSAHHGALEQSLYLFWDAEFVGGYFLYDNETVTYLKEGKPGVANGWRAGHESDNGDFFCCGETYTNWAKMYPWFSLERRGSEFPDLKADELKGDRRLTYEEWQAKKAAKKAAETGKADTWGVAWRAAKELAPIRLRADGRPLVGSENPYDNPSAYCNAEGKPLDGSELVLQVLIAANLMEPGQTISITTDEGENR